MFARMWRKGNSHWWKCKLAEPALAWWLSGKESTCQFRRLGFDPWSRKIPRTVGQLNSCTTTESVLQSPGATNTEPPCAATEARESQSPCSATREAAVMRSRAPKLESSPRPLQLEKAHGAIKTQHSWKHIHKIMGGKKLAQPQWKTVGRFLNNQK